MARRKRKSTALRKPRKLAIQDLRTATAASVKAVLGRGFPRRPGVLAGIYMRDVEIMKLPLRPQGIAAEVAKRASQASAIQLRPAVVKVSGGALVGYIQPNILKGG